MFLNTRTFRVLTLVTGALGFVIASLACSEAEKPAANSGAGGSPAAGGGNGQEGGSAAAPQHGGGQAGNSNSAGAPSEEDCPEYPSEVPHCWKRLQYPPKWGECDIFYPGPKGDMPPPIVWDNIQLPTIPSIPARVMNRETPHGEFDAGVFYYGWFDQENSRVLLSFNRGVRDYIPRYRILADADGPVLNAILNIHPPNTTCEFAPKPFNTPHFLLNVYPLIENSYEGAIIFPEGSREPPKAIFLPKVPTSTFRVSNEHIVRWDKNGLFSRTWTDETEINILNNQDSPSSVSYVMARDGAVFTTVTGSLPGTNIWKTGLESKPFIRFENGSSRGAWNAVTDGRDWVWTEGTYQDGKWGQFELFTAPYTLDANELRTNARRLHTEPTGWASTTFTPTVGCGYRARIHVTDNYHLHVTRLEDGQRWILSNPHNPSEAGFSLGTTLAVTCEEVFVHSEPGMLLRIRLSDLGPGQPPD